MKQLLGLSALLLCIGIVTLTQYENGHDPNAPIEWDLDTSKLYASADYFDLVKRNASLRPPLPDTLGETETLNHISRLYGLQSAILAAEARGDHARVDHLIGKAMEEMNTLLRQPNAGARPRLRELYRTLATEYETYYGVPDTTRLPDTAFYRERKRMFAALNAVEPAPSLAEVQGEELRPQKATVPLPYNGLVRSAITYLQRDPEKHVYRWLRRKETYFPMIEHVFAQEGVPDELKYLALVESGLKPKSESWASAAGLWQFMPTTGRAYGLSITPWVDERLDPEKSTRAAARHLKDLYRMFNGDWLLALSGYNCSPTKIRRAMRKARRELGRRPTFWDIYEDIPKETRNYVPTFVATALMLSNPGTFGLKRVAPGPRYQFDYVPVDGMVPLQKVAELSGTSVERIRALNPELRRATLPPSRKPYYVRIPYGTYDQFAKGYQKLPDQAKDNRLTYEVKPNDTLEKIAERYGVSVAELVETNDLKHAMIQSREQLEIPGQSYKGNLALVEQADAAPLSVRYTSRTARPLAATGLPGTTLADQRLVMHRVESGDTLLEIARQYDVSTNQIMQWNNLPSNRLDVGQQLKIYG